MDAVKFAEGSDTDLIGLLAPNGGIFNGSDIQGERFTAKTDFCLDWFAERPLLYHHGLDPDVGTAVVGRIKSLEPDDLGLWMKAQLDKGSKYYNAIKQLIEQGALQLSSGAMAHLAKVAKSGDILKWPLVEGTLTPTPANPLATVDFATAKAHFKAIDVDLETHSLKETLDAAAREDLGASDFAYIDSQGGKHLPINDEAHVRAAMARWNQTTFESDEAKQAAKRKIIAAARKFGIEVSPDFAEKAADLSALAGSYEQLVGSLNAALNAYNPFGPSDRFAYVGATYADHCKAYQHANGEGHWYDVAFTQSPDGTVKLGTVALSAEDAALPEPPEALAQHTELVTSYAAALAQRTKDLSERRTKEGRVLSAATRQRLSDCLTAMRGACDEMAGFLDSTDPAKAEAKAELGRLLGDIDLLVLESALVLH